MLANEEVTADGRSDVGNYPVYRRPLRQWMLRITAYADRLIDDLDLVDWPESDQADAAQLDRRQRRGCIDFPVAGHGRICRIEVFTTRPDTLLGATYVVLAPEHPLVASLAADGLAGRDAAAWRYPGRPATARRGLGPVRGRSPPTRRWPGG